MKISPTIESFLFGITEQKLAIQAFRFNTKAVSTNAKHVLILGGVHGDETEGVVLAQALLAELMTSQALKLDLRITLVPTFNLDGVLQKTRGNSRGVDLNRNLPTKDWSNIATTPRYQPGPHPQSESENKALVSFIESDRPDFILSLHSWKPMLNINEPEGSALCRHVAEAIASITGDVIEPTIGYSTPGCLGTYTGLERNIPTLTYEIERGLSPEAVVEKHLKAVIKGLRALESNF